MHIQPNHFSFMPSQNFHRLFFFSYMYIFTTTAYGCFIIQAWKNTTATHMRI